MRREPTPKTFEILLVEDSWGDALLMREAFRESRLPARLSIVTNGEEALAYLNREPRYPEAKIPDLILLDLNLPRMDGRIFLRRLRHNPRFKELVVVVLTSSDLESDLREVQELEAQGYIIKTGDLKGFLQTAEILKDHWLGPKGPQGGPGPYGRFQG